MTTSIYLFSGGRLFRGEGTHMTEMDRPVDESVDHPVDESVSGVSWQDQPTYDFAFQTGRMIFADGREYTLDRKGQMHVVPRDSGENHLVGKHVADMLGIIKRRLIHLFSLFRHHTLPGNQKLSTNGSRHHIQRVSPP